ncbi:hypothetical protein [Novosphingopyxis sp.]|uniref:hypothetical protein n=1 Tax=Novosphingopyxis sp. TaxID=2709690 RepID=UPI003B5A7FA7
MSFLRVFIFGMNQKTLSDDIELEDLLTQASALAGEAARACREWEDGGDPDAVGDTAVYGSLLGNE